MLHRGYGLTKALGRRPIQLRACRSLVPCWARYFSSEPPPSHDVAVLGGGITGLACAYYLTRELPRAKITIYEASDRLGGWLSSTRVPVKDGSVLFEAGPRTLRPSSNGALSAQLMQELDLAKDAIFTQRTSPAAQSRYIYYPDHLVRMPHPAFGFFENLYSLWSEPIFKGVVWSSATEIMKDARSSDIQDESVGAFFTRRFSKAPVERIVSAILHGIYAGDAWQLSAKSLFPTIWRDEVKEGSVWMGMLKSRAEGLEVTKREANYIQTIKNYVWEPLLRATLKDNSVFTFRDGLGMMSDALARSLFASGKVEFKTSTLIDSITMAEGNKGVAVATKESQEPTNHTDVVSALAPETLNSLHQKSSQRLVPSMPSVTVMTVNLYYRKPNLNPPGFGYLIPNATSFENNPERALGVVFDTAYSPSPLDLDMANWMTTDADALKVARDAGRLVNINDFAWYNLPQKANMQDDVKERGSKLTVMLGGHNWDGWPAYPDEKEGLAMAKAVVERHLGIKEEPEVYRVNLQRDCIPQYTVGHEERLKSAHRNIEREYKGRLRVAGNWMWGVGVNDCIRSAWEVAQGMKLGRRATGLEHIGTEEYTRLKRLQLDDGKRS